MAFDENIYKLRLDKLKQIEALGQPAYPTRYEYTHTVPQILAEYSDKTAEQLENPRVNLRVAGRTVRVGITCVSGGFDSGLSGVLDVLPRVEGKTIGFGSHVQRELLDAARAAGCEVVLKRSEFFARLAELIGAEA